MPAFSWKKLKNAEVFGRGIYLLPGNYKLRLLKMFTIETRDKGAALIVDFEVVESDNDRIPVGATKNWYQGLQDKDIAFPAVKDFLLALFGIDMSDDEAVEEFEEGLEDLMEESSDDAWKNKEAEDHPLHGKTIAVECFNKKTKKSGADFTVHNWQAWDGEDD
jgi:hypothetical protein